MQHTSINPTAGRNRPVVALMGNGTTGFGRGIIRGAMRYANLERRWLIYEELNVEDLCPADWPQFDGAIIAGAPEPLRSEVAARTKHFVVCSGSADPAQHPVVSLDDFAVGVLAARHLLECQLTRFVFHGLSNVGTAANRYRGFKQTIEAAGHVCVDSGFAWMGPGEIIQRKRLAAVVDWLKAVEKPIGIMCIDDTAAHGIAAACVEADVSVPDEVAIIGVNNDDLLCESSWPPLSSVDGDYSRVGFAGAQMLDRLLRGEKITGDARAVRLAPLGIVARQSTDMLAVADAHIRDALRYIRQRACDPCTVSDILREVPVTRRWLERRFASLIGHGPYDEILRVRIEAAKRMLLLPGISLEEVSAKCGFSTIQQFRRAFQRSTGTTPGAFRRDRLQSRS